MKALVFDGTLRFVDDYPAPVPVPGEARIKVTMAGICDTDMQITKGYLGFAGVLGHEFVGIVDDVNGPDQGLIGRRVVGEINIACGVCEYCSKGLGRHCPSRTTLGIDGRDGAFAEYVTLPLSCLHPLPASLSDEDAVFTEPLAACFEILEQVHIRPTERILVLGDGKLGLLAAAVLRLTHADVLLVGKHEEKLAIARTLGINALGLDASDRGRLWDVVIDTTGSATGFGTALSQVRPRGTIVLKTTVADGTQLNLSPLVIDEITVVGSRCGPFGPALQHLSQGLIDVRQLVSAVYPFTDALSAFEAASRPDSLKILLDFRNGL